MPACDISDLIRICSNGNNLISKKKYLKSFLPVWDRSGTNGKLYCHIQIMMVYCLALLPKKQVLPFLLSSSLYIRELATGEFDSNRRGVGGDETRDALLTVRII